MSDQPSSIDLELFHRVENEPEGTFKIYMADGVGTEENISQHLENIRVVAEKIKHAAQSRCFIEVISLRLQVIDFWLRIYFYNVPNNAENREREFGRLLKQCYRHKLEKNLYDELVLFNRHRVDAIHGFMIGTIAYEKIQEVATEADHLLRKTVVYVINNSGMNVTSREDLAANRGSMTIHAKGFCHEVMNGGQY